MLQTEDAMAEYERLPPPQTWTGDKELVLIAMNGDKDEMAEKTD